MLPESIGKRGKETTLSTRCSSLGSAIVEFILWNLFMLQPLKKFLINTIDLEPWDKYMSKRKVRILSVFAFVLSRQTQVQAFSCLYASGNLLEHFSINQSSSHKMHLILILELCHQKATSQKEHNMHTTSHFKYHVGKPGTKLEIYLNSAWYLIRALRTLNV